MKKLLSLGLAAAMAMSAMPMAYATTDVSNGTLVEYNADDQDGDGQLDNLDYFITVPAKLAPAGSGTVTLEGMWPSNATVKVTAEDKVELVNSITGADEKVLGVTFLGIEKAGNNTERKTYTETVSVADISAALFGTWEGVFNYNVDYIAGPDWVTVEWEPELQGTMIWTDGNDMYHSFGEDQYVLQGDTWVEKEWDLTNFSTVNAINGARIWNDNQGNTYLSNGKHYKLVDGEWEPTSWNIDFTDASMIWTDGTNIYYSNGLGGESYGVVGNYILQGDTWVEKQWYGLEDIAPAFIWSDHEGNVYYSRGSEHYKLNGDTWTPTSWNNWSDVIGVTSIGDIWSDGAHTYYSEYAKQYVLQGDTWVEKQWYGLESFLGTKVWTDGTNLYYSEDDTFKLVNR